MAIKKAKDLFIIDTDIHLIDSPDALAPYCERPWRRALEHMGEAYQGIFNIPGYTPYLALDPIFPEENWAGRKTESAQQMREELDKLEIDIGILFPSNMLYLPILPDPNYAAALARAYNDWMVDRWLGRNNGLKGVLLIPPQNPKAAVREIERYANEPDIVGVCFVATGVKPLYGNMYYDPIYQAAQDANLPITLHAVEAVHDAFPFNLHQYETGLARHAISHSFAMMANLISILNTGVPVRFPKLKIAFMEAGVSWVPFLMYRLDREFLVRRREVPFLDKPPSEYMKAFYYGTQPIEEPEPLSRLADIIRSYDGENNTMYASDWPHYDFDHPNKILQIPLSDQAKRKIMAENAIRFFNLDEQEAKQYGN